MKRVPLEPLGESRRRAVAEALPGLRIGGLIGSGAGGWVLDARDEATGERFALKVLADERLRDPTARARLRAEARVLTTCRHRNLVRALALHDHEDMLILVLERVDGANLFEETRRRRHPVMTLCQILSAVAHALQAVHDLGFLHGDVKPENVLVDPAGRHRLIDFQLARPWPFPVESPVAGTPWYMAPEALQPGGHLVPATDVYALGVMSYELFAGHLPFPPAATGQAVSKQQLERAPFPLGLTAPALPLALYELVAEAMARRPADRIASARAFADRVDRIIGGLHAPCVDPQGGSCG